MSVIPVEWKGSILSKVMLIAQDIGQKHELEKLANTDALTGLYNERYLSERLKRNGKLHKKFAMFYLELDRVKPVNDTYGHDMGDRLLKAVSRRLCKCIRKTDYAFRIGGDEFVIFLKDKTRQNVEEYITMIQRELHIADDQTDIPVSAAIGYAWTSEKEKNLEKLLNEADEAMYENKKELKNERD